MKQQSASDMIAEARSHSIGNRAEIECSRYAKCFSCGGSFKASAVADWKDEWTAPEKTNRVKRWSAICPDCGAATVIGDASGLFNVQYYIPVLMSFIEEQHARR